MWYIDGHKYEPERYTELLDGFQNNAAMITEMGNFEELKLLMEARCHGNPHLDTVTIGWHENTSQKRAENDSFRAASASDEVAEILKLGFEAIGGSQSFVEGSLYIIDIDDPELVEHGEAHIHRQLTSHLADPITKPREEWEPWMAPVYDTYIDSLFLENIANGFVPGAIVAEIERQRLGLPYEWYGARID